MYQYIIYLLGFFIFIQVVNYFIMIRRLLHMRFNYAKLIKIDCNLISEEDKKVFDIAEQKLTQLGFSFFTCYQATTINKFYEDPIPYKVYLNSKTKSYVWVSINHKNPTLGFDTTFVNYYSDEGAIITLNGEYAFSVFPKKTGFIYQDFYVSEMEEQWQKHQQSLKTETGVIYTPEQCFELEKKALNNFVNQLYAEKQIIKTPQDDFKLSFISALKLAISSFHNANKFSAIIKNKKEIYQDDTVIAKEIALYQQVKQKFSLPPLGWLTKTLLFLLTILGFSIIFGLSFSLASIAILVLVLFIHESGHILAMYFFKYKELQMLFIPFLGAVAMGKSETATPYQRLIIYLMGPVPGIFLAFICFYFYTQTGNTLLREIGIMALVLNIFNLLPVMPLDGGQVVNMALFERFPWLQVIFLSLSVVLFALGTYFLNSPVLLVLAIFLALSIPNYIQTATILKRFKASISNKNVKIPKQEKLLQIFSFLQQYPKFSFNAKASWADFLLQNGYQQSPKISSTFVILFIYLTTLASPVFLSLALFPEATIRYYHAITGFQYYSQSFEKYKARYDTHHQFAIKADWSAILENWNTVAMAHMAYFLKQDNLFVEQVKKNNSILLKGADETEIAAFEQQFKLVLPKEYRDFLKVSNGMYIIEDDVVFLSIANIEKVSVSYIEQWKSFFDSHNLSPFFKDISLYELQDSFIISSQEDIYVYFLKYYQGQWEFWELDQDELYIYRYQNFKELIADMYARSLSWLEELS